MKKRADLLLVEKKLASTRSKAQAIIMAGQLTVNGRKIIKSGELVDDKLDLIVSQLQPEWVSRGAIKLLHAIKFFNINIEDKVCLDIGASTGGFSQVLLKNNAKKIYCVDSGKNQLHEKLKKEKRIVNLEKTNARYLEENIFSEKIDILLCDVSFISLKKVIQPNLFFLNKKKGLVLCLIKPQFEASKIEIKKGGIIKDESVHKRICDDITKWFEKICNMSVLGITKSPIKGPKGNIEFFIFAKFN